MLFRAAKARVLARAYPEFDAHVFPTCFGCGPARTVGDGLRIFSSGVPGRELVAAPWTIDPTLVGPDGYIKTEFVWAALDGPGGWAVAEFHTRAEDPVGTAGGGDDPSPAWW